MILLSFAAIALLSNVAIAVPYDGLCDSAATCTEAHTVCEQQSACLKGVCVCASGYFRVNNTSCEPDIWLGASCTTDCSAGYCNGGKCQCWNGYVASSDNKQCTPQGKALGGACTRWSDCLGAILGAHVTCNTTCQCLPGYKPKDANSCTYYGDGEGCTQDTTQCPPVHASCSNTTNPTKCACDTVAGTKYVWWSDAGLCVHPSFKKDVGYGETCTVGDYGATGRVCSKGLTCAICPENDGTTKYECLNLNGVGQIRASSLVIFTVLLFGIKIALFTA